MTPGVYEVSINSSNKWSLTIRKHSLSYMPNGKVQSDCRTGSIELQSNIIICFVLFRSTSCITLICILCLKCMLFAAFAEIVI